MFLIFLQDLSERVSGRSGSLITFLSPAVYLHIEDCETKPMTRPWQSWRGFMLQRKTTLSSRSYPTATAGLIVAPNHLKVFSKDCSFRAVTVEQHRQHLLLYFFISGILSSTIRIRLLEKDGLILEAILDRAQEQSSSWVLSVVASETSLLERPPFPPTISRNM